MQDAVHDVARIDRENIRMSGLHADCLAGIATVRAADTERTLALLGIDRLLRASSACWPD